jgi:hypothetical protein
MSTIEETGKEVEKQVVSFLSGRPVWVWWIAYTVFCGLIFGVLYLVFYVLMFKWWIDLILVIAAGIIWGTIAYYSKKTG